MEAGGGGREGRTGGGFCAWAGGGLPNVDWIAACCASTKGDGTALSEAGDGGGGLRTGAPGLGVDNEMADADFLLGVLG